MASTALSGGCSARRSSNDDKIPVTDVSHLCCGVSRPSRLIGQDTRKETPMPDKKQFNREESSLLAA